MSPWRGAVLRRGGCFLIRHPEASLYEAVRISSFKIILHLAKGRCFFYKFLTTKVHQFLFFLFGSRFTAHDSLFLGMRMPRRKGRSSQLRI